MADDTITGLGDLANGINQAMLALSAPQLQAAALAAVQPMLADAQQNIPKRTGQTEHRLQATAHATGPASAVATVQVVQSAKAQPGHLAIFLEYGTVNMPAHPFMRPAFVRNATRAQAIVAQYLASNLPST